jgi:hypothetical protein
LLSFYSFRQKNCDAIRLVTIPTYSICKEVNTLATHIPLNHSLKCLRILHEHTSLSFHFVLDLNSDLCFLSVVHVVGDEVAAVFAAEVVFEAYEQRAARRIVLVVLSYWFRISVVHVVFDEDYFGCAEECEVVR